MSLITSSNNPALNDFKTTRSYNTSLPFSSQRWRYFVESGGTLQREFIQYGNTTGFDELTNFKRITTSSGNTYEMRTAEKFNVHAKNDAFLSFIFNMNRSLAAGEKAVIGYGEPDLVNNMASADGWFFELEPQLDDNEALITIYENGQIVSNGGSKQLITLDGDITETTQLSMAVSPGPLSAMITFESFVQKLQAGQTDERTGKVVLTTGAGPAQTNGHLTYSVRGTGLEMSIGDTVVKQESTHIDRRPKEYFFEDPMGTATNTWVPLRAFRIDPNRDNINVGVSEIFVGGLHNKDTRFLSLGFFGFHSSKVTFTGGDSWAAANGSTNNFNDVLESRSDVAQVANATGTLATNPNDIGGFQIKRETLSSIRSNFKEGFVRSQSASTIQPLSDPDIGIFASKSPVGDSDVRYAPVFLQEW